MTASMGEQSAMTSSPKAIRSPLLRGLWFCLGLLAVVLGVIGIWLPGLPTTPFMILAAACFARSSDRMHHWLLSHKTFGPMIHDWQKRGAISKRAKKLSVLMMAAAFAMTLLLALPLWVVALQAAILMGVGYFILSRPD